MAVIYWEIPLENDYSLIHPLSGADSHTEYARYMRDYKMDVEKLSKNFCKH